jgi:rhodanese-related sulfurtransferase
MTNRLLQACAFAALAIVPAVVFAPAASAAAAETEYPLISLDDLQKAIADKGVTLIDANGTNSWQSGHIPGAINLDAHQSDLATLLPKDKGALIVSYCGGPGCEAYRQGADAAVALGYTNVKHFKLGISGWKASGAATEAGDAKVH